MTRPRKIPRCRDHDKAMVLLAGDGYACLSCERGDPPSNPRLEQVPVRRDYDTRDEYETAMTDWKKRFYASRKGRDF